MDDPQAQYWLIKAILLVALLLIGWFLIRPIHSQGHLAFRRLGMLLTIVFAMFAVLFPGLLNRVAWRLGVERGINLLVYVLVLALFAQIATAYRRDSTAEKRLTALARAIALHTVRLPPSDTAGRTAESAAPADETLPGGGTALGGCQPPPMPTREAPSRDRVHGVTDS